MAVQQIITGSSTAILRRKSQKVGKVTKDVIKLIKDMRDTVKDAGGLGIAAPQINVSKAVCLALFNGKMHVMVDPKILWKSKELCTMEEGCLSLPGEHVDVERAVEITVAFRDEKGREQERLLHDLDARVVQHEIDHLHGILIVDYR